MEADGENVIYVQVDEHGRVVNYTTNMPGGEQVNTHGFQFREIVKIFF
jgi:hypothetical protein